MAESRNRLELENLGLSKKQRQAGSISFDVKRKNELRKLWSDYQRLQNKLYKARTKNILLFLMSKVFLCCSRVIL